MVRIFSSTVSWGGRPVERLAIPFLIECRFDSGRLQVARMNEFGNVVAGGEANVNGMLRPGASIIIFETLS
jgi:hypothetical protein